MNPLARQALALRAAVPSGNRHSRGAEALLDAVFLKK
jgi:hypothetical protein